MARRSGVFVSVIGLAVLATILAAAQADDRPQVFEQGGVEIFFLKQPAAPLGLNRVWVRNRTIDATIQNRSRTDIVAYRIGVIQCDDTGQPRIIGASPLIQLRSPLRAHGIAPVQPRGMVNPVASERQFASVGRYIAEVRFADGTSWKQDVDKIREAVARLHER